MRACSAVKYSARRPVRERRSACNASLSTEWSYGYAIPHLWLLDTSLETLETYRLESGHWVLLAIHSANDVMCDEAFDAIEIDLKRLWGR